MLAKKHGKSETLRGLTQGRISRLYIHFQLPETSLRLDSGKAELITLTELLKSITRAK